MSTQPESAGRGPYEVRVIEDQWATFRHIVEAVAIVCAGVWAFYTFVYTEKIKPASEPAALAVSTSIQSIGRDRSRDLISVALVFRNTGKTEIDVAADGFNVWGERYGSRATIRRKDRPDAREYDATLPIVSRRLISAAVELRDAAIGGRRGAHIILEPGESETINEVLAVPRGAYDIIHSQVIAVPVKTSRTEKLAITVSTNRVGGYWLIPDPRSDSEEDDNSADFGLAP